MSRRQQKAVFANMESPISSRPLSKTARDKILEREFGEKNKNLTFKQLKRKGIVLSKTGDADKDGVKNIKDCRPFNKKKHFVSALALGVGASYVGSKLAERPEKKQTHNPGTEHAGKRRYGVYWSGERVDSFGTRKEAADDIKERVKAGKLREDYEIALESHSGVFIKTLK